MELNELRDKIDALDAEIIDLFKKRMAVSAEVAKYKAERGLPVLDEAREQKKLAKISDMAGEDISSYACALYNIIFDLSRAKQEQLMNKESKTLEIINDSIDKTNKVFPEFAEVACQGVAGSYSTAAAKKLFRYPEITYCPTFESVFEMISAGKCRYGILPIENSNAGSVHQVYDLMMKYKFYIVRSTRVHIDHQLLAREGVKKEDIKEVLSHEQALLQSEEYLRRLGATPVPCPNTAVAAETVATSDRCDIAAISSRECAKIYGLSVLECSIQDNGNNHTRFICISKEPEIYPGADKTSVMIVTSNRAGSLYRVMSRFNALGINLAKLESRPIPDRDFEVMFYFDLDESVYSMEFKNLIYQLDGVCEQFRYLGSYSEIS